MIENYLDERTKVESVRKTGNVIIYFFGIIFVLGGGLMIFDEKIIEGLFYIVLGILELTFGVTVWRITCEAWSVIFKTRETQMDMIREIKEIKENQ